MESGGRGSVSLVWAAIEHDPDLRSDLYDVGLDTHDVGRQVDRRIVRERDVSDHIRRREVGEPLLMVHRQPDHRGEPGHHARGDDFELRQTGQIGDGG